MKGRVPSLCSLLKVVVIFAWSVKQIRKCCFDHFKRDSRSESSVSGFSEAGFYPAVPTWCLNEAQQDPAGKGEEDSFRQMFHLKVCDVGRPRSPRKRWVRGRNIARSAKDRRKMSLLPFISSRYGKQIIRLDLT